MTWFVWLVLVDRMSRLLAVSVHIRFPTNEMGTDNTFETLALVVPDNKYNARVTLVIGTNLTVRCKVSCESLQGLMFLQTTKLSSVWRRAYQSLKYHESLGREKQ